MAKRTTEPQTKKPGLFGRLFPRSAGQEDRQALAPRVTGSKRTRPSAPKAARPAAAASPTATGSAPRVARKAAATPSAVHGQPTAKVLAKGHAKQSTKPVKHTPVKGVATKTKRGASKPAKKAGSATPKSTKTKRGASKPAKKAGSATPKSTKTKRGASKTSRKKLGASKTAKTKKAKAAKPPRGAKRLTPAQQRERTRRERLAAKQREAKQRAAARREREAALRRARKERAAAQRLAAKQRAAAIRERAKARLAAARERERARLAAAREREAAKAARVAAQHAAKAARIAARDAAKADRVAAREAARQAKEDARLAAKAARLTAKLAKKFGTTDRSRSAPLTEDGMAPTTTPLVFEHEIAQLAAAAVNGRIPLSEVEKLVERLESSEIEEIPDIAAIFTALAARGIEVDDEIDEAELREATAVAAKLIAASSGEADLDAFQQWRRDALSHPILTRAEETELTTRYLLYAKTAKALEAARVRLEEKRALLAESAADPEIDAAYRATLDEEIKGLVAELTVMDEEIERAQSLARAAENQFISYNFRLVVSIANRKHKATGRKGDFMDLVQQGNLGMLEAFRRFDPTKGWKFSTFASWHIQQAVSLWLYEQVGTLRVPTHRWRDARSIDKIRLEFQQNGQEATLEQIAERMGKTPKKIQEILAAQTLTRTGSLDKPISDEDGAGTLGDLVGDANADDPGDIAVSEALKTVFADAFERVLDGRERRVLQLRYGVYDSQKQTLEWIGRRMNITRERVRQIEERALAKLRKDREVREIGDGRLSRERLGEGG